MKSQSVETTMQAPEKGGGCLDECPNWVGQLVTHFKDLPSR